MGRLMKNFKVLCLLSVLFSFFNSQAQVDPQIQRYRDDDYGIRMSIRESTFDGNLVRSIFRNDGQISKFLIFGMPSLGEWPIGSEHTYFNGYTLIVSSEVVAPGNGALIHPVQGAFYEFIDHNPQNSSETWTFQPIPHYNRDTSEYCAINLYPDTWPEVWPEALNLDSSWNGHWYGYLGKDNFSPSFEAFFVMDDAIDKEWTKSPYNFYPLINDSNRAGLGLRVETRILQFDHPFTEDIVFVNYDIINISDFNYSKTCLGIYLDPAIGGIYDCGDDNVSLTEDTCLVYFYDSDGISPDPPPTWSTGYLGYSFLESPLSDSLPNQFNSISAYQLSSPLGLKDDEIIWQKMSSNQIDTSIQNVNLMAVVGVGPFNFPKWQTERFVVGIILGEDLEDLIFNKIVAKTVYDSNYVIPDSISAIGGSGNTLLEDFSLSQNYPNPFKPNTKINFSVANLSRVSLKVYDILGREIITLVNEVKPAGQYEVNLNANDLASGVYFYQIKAGDFIQSKKMILIK